MWTSVHDYIFLGVDSLIVGLLYSAYKRRDSVIKSILNAPSVAVGPDLDRLLEEHSNEVPYVALRGKVHPFGRPIESNTGLSGVLQVVTLNEHSVRRHAFGHWGDSVRTLQQSQNSVPFSLRNLTRSDKELLVEIQNPFEANMENLLLPVSTNFAPTNSTVASTVMGFFTGHASKGYETTEDLLPVDTVITGLGHVVRDSSGHIVMTEPSEGTKFPYILSTLPIESIVKRLENRNFYLRLTTYVCATLGIIIAIRRLNEWWKVRKANRMREKILNNRSQKNLEGLSEAETCIVCLTNPREILLMDCGHVAVCADCCAKLNGKCPVCRRTIAGTHAAYIA